MNPVVFLVLLSFCMLVFRYHMPLSKGPAGTLIRAIDVPIRARVRLQRANIYGMGAVMVLGGLGNWLPALAEILLALGVMGVLFLPLTYRLTDLEIALGRSRPRKWTEFRSIDQQAGRLVLKSDDGRDLVVWLPGTKEDSAVLAEIRSLVRPAASARRETSSRPARRPGRHGRVQRVV